ncbi:MAG: 2-polyprenyl-3-methyl-6-methoxy-1,4-benzoquinone monooxygenase [Marinagarivorans sp.]|nr:2-polyprenyl-3-methyl-6-methoxy-1,4-benzoquinone monooxygenase [Marinagarivorans sp.]
MPHKNNFRQHNFLDHGIAQFDSLLRTLHGKRTQVARANPANAIPEAELSSREKNHSAGLMRVNHTGEVCAQALYQGQALTAKLPTIRAQLHAAAIEEEDHLAWCQQRLNELNAQSSYLNPLWYGLSFGIGAGAGAISDKLSLGFVAATEEQVCKHLHEHMQSLPSNDLRSKAIVTQMYADEAEHASFALNAGGIDFPQSVKKLMSYVATLMTWASYRL